MRGSRESTSQPDDDADEVSWKLIEPGMVVLASDGTAIGHVTHVLGDPNLDIFDGVGFRHHMWTAHRMVPAAMIAHITAQAVSLHITAAEAEQCPAYQDEHVYRVGETGFFRHHTGWRESNRL